MKTLSIKEIINRCVEKITDNYEKKKEDYLTEGDVTSSLFCLLKDEMEKHNIEGLKIHRELRPYVKMENNSYVIKQVNGAIKWEQHKPKNSGAVVDIAIIKSEQEYFEQAEEVAPKKYWRLLTYPLDAFVACIEVKIRVSGNISRIKKDIDKLCKIRDTIHDRGKECFVHLVVLDSEVSDQSRKKIENLCKGFSVGFTMARTEKRKLKK